MTAHAHALPPVTGTVPPHSVEAERAILGAILLHPSMRLEVLSAVEPRDFYHPAHEAIYTAICDLDRTSQPIDALTIAAHMRAHSTLQKLRALDGEAYFALLCDAVVTPENVGFHAAMVGGRARVRRIVDAAHAIVARGLSEYGDLDDYCATAEASILAATSERATTAAVPLRDVIASTYAAIEARAEMPDGITGVTSGFRDLDTATSGWHAGDLVIVAARPSMGKTSLALDFVLGAASAGVPALVFSLEMSSHSLAQRTLSASAHVGLRQVRAARMNATEWRDLMQARSRAMRLPVWLDETPAPSVVQIRAAARRWRTQSTDPAAPALVVVDYLQLVATVGRVENRTQAVAEQSRALKLLARELHCPVIVLSQLNRGVESRADKRPLMSDLRDSGAIEQDADVIAFIYRDEVYNPDSRDAGTAEIILAKQRNEATGMVRLAWDAPTATFRSIASIASRTEH